MELTDQKDHSDDDNGVNDNNDDNDDLQRCDDEYTRYLQEVATEIFERSSAEGNILILFSS